MLITNTAATSLLMHTFITMKIYQNVDISVRPNTYDFVTLYMSRCKSKNNSRFNSFGSNKIEWKLLSQQESFQTALAAHSEKGSLVTSFTWTYYLPKSDITGLFHRINLEEMLDTMSNLQAINVYALTKPNTPIPLKSATIIRLSGCISQLLSEDTADLSKITTLELDNIIERPDHQRRRGGRNMPRLVRYPKALKAPGCELDYTKLTGHCSSLKNLAIRSYGQGINGSDRWDADADKLRYARWSDFIASTSPTLETLEFELFDIAEANSRHKFARGPARFKQNITLIFPSQLSNKPMNRRFVEIMVPVLAQQSWPKLRKVTISGLVEQESVLREAFGSDIELKFWP